MKKLMLFLMLMVAVLASNASAVNVLTNPGFELPELADGEYIEGTTPPAGWSYGPLSAKAVFCNTVGGIYEGTFPDTAYEGEQLVDLYGHEGSGNPVAELTQDVAISVGAGETYTFTAHMLKPSWSTREANLTLTISWDGGSVSDSIIYEDTENWGEFSVILNTDLEPTAVGASQLTVSALCDATGQTATDILIDGMVLDAASAPVPVATTAVGDGVEVTEDQLDHPTDTYTVSMLSAPPIDRDSDSVEGVEVTMDFPADQISIVPSSFTFTADNWETPQTFTVTALDDSDAQGDRTVDITHSLTLLDPDDNVISETDPNIIDPDFVSLIFEAGTDIVPATIIDDDVAPVNLLINPGFELPELADGEALEETAPAYWSRVGFTYHVNTVPTSTYSIYDGLAYDGEQLADLYGHGVSGNSIAEITQDVAVSVGAGETYTFTAHMIKPHWSSREANLTLTISWAGGSVSDSVIYEDTETWGEFSVTLDTDIETSAVGASQLTVSALCDSTDQIATDILVDGMVLTGPTTPVATIDVGDGVEVTEDQLDYPTDTYTVSMLYAPPIDRDGDGIQGVQVTMDFPDDQISIDPNGFIFTADNWETPRTITVTALDDFDLEGDHTVYMAHSMILLDPDDNTMLDPDPNVIDPLFENPGFSGTSIVPVTIIDDELNYGVLIDVLDGVAVSEQEPATATDTYTVVLRREPTITVLVDINITDSQTTVDKTALTFDSDNWDIPQVVTVTAVDDTAGEDDPHTGQIVHSIPDLGTSEEALNWFNAPILPSSTVDVSISDNDCRADRVQPGDTDNDCDVDMDDFAAFAANWLECTLPNVPGCE